MPELPEDVIEAYLNKALPASDPHAVNASLAAKAKEYFGVDLSHEETQSLTLRSLSPFREAYLAEIASTRLEMGLHLAARAAEFEEDGIPALVAAQFAMQRFGNPLWIGLRTRAIIALHLLPKAISYCVHAAATSPTASRIIISIVLILVSFLLSLDAEILMRSNTISFQHLEWLSHIAFAGTSMSSLLEAFLISQLFSSDEMQRFASRKPTTDLKATQRLSRFIFKVRPWVVFVTPLYLFAGDYNMLAFAIPEGSSLLKSMAYQSAECHVCGIIVGGLFWFSLGRTKTVTAR